MKPWILKLACNTALLTAISATSLNALAQLTTTVQQTPAPTQDPMSSGTWTTPNQTTTLPADPNAAAGQQFGSQLYPNPQKMVTTSSTNGVTSFTDANGNSMDANALFPGSTGGDVSQYSNLAGDNNGIAAATDQAVLNSQNSTSAHSTAYQAVQQGSAQAHPNLTNDPLFVQTDYVNNNQATIQQQFTNCTQQTVTTTTGTTTSHVPQLVSCQRSSSISGSDTLIHNYTILPPFTVASENQLHGPCLQNSDGSYDCTQFQGTPQSDPFSDKALSSCGSDCIEIVLGHVASSVYLEDPNACFAYQVTMSLTVPVPAAIESVNLISLGYDDRMSIQLNGNEVYSGNGGVQLPAGVVCDPGYTYFTTPNQDVTALFANQTQLNFSVYVENGGGGLAYAIFQVRYNKDALINDQGWASQGAVDMAQTASTCPTGSISVTQTPPLDSNGCSQFYYDTYCPSDFPAPPVSSINPLTQQASVTLNNCAANLGSSSQCTTSASGQTICPNNTTSNTSTNNCTQYQNNPSCGYESTQCLTQDANGNCMIFEDTYDCGQNVLVPTQTQQQLLNCNGTIPCIGESCSTKQQDVQNQSALGQAAAGLQIAQSVSTDGICPGGNMNSCTIWPSTGGSCHETVGGLVNDCCNGKTGATFKTLMDMSLAAVGDNDASQRLQNEDPTYGAWATLSGGGLFGTTTLQQPVASQQDIIGGTTSQNNGGQSATANNTTQQQALMDHQATVAVNGVGSQPASQMYQQNSSGHYSYTAAIQGSFDIASGLMSVYEAWEMQLALLNYISPCSQRELTTVSKVHAYSCHFIGSKCDADVLGLCLQASKVYCCYNTPLARIVSEQIYPQLGISYGTADNPNCPAGIPIGDLSQVNWSQVNMNEYLGILQMTGNVPDPTQPQNLSITAVTSTNSVLNTGNRPDATAQAAQRVQDMQPELNRQATDQNMWGGSPVVPGPAPSTPAPQ